MLEAAALQRLLSRRLQGHLKSSYSQ